MFPVRILGLVKQYRLESFHRAIVRVSPCFVNIKLILGVSPPCSLILCNEYLPVFPSKHIYSKIRILLLHSFNLRNWCWKINACEIESVLRRIARWPNRVSTSWCGK